MQNKQIDIYNSSETAKKKQKTDSFLNNINMHNASEEKTGVLQLQDHIKLTVEEEKLFEFLLDVETQNNCETCIRVAGGWVRDKLLGRNSDDIDIVLNKMTGVQFAEYINKYETQHGHKKHAVGIIKANPDQSKHLETATMKLGTGWVDFVNLRSESYSDQSRIPKMEFGSPLEDARRRDFTINSMFYNIREKKVEDFIGQGLEDLRNRMIRTPLNPKTTFMDDPIRVLRAIRFASRFDFKLDEQLCKSISDAEVKDSLMNKISRERVGIELLGMITGNRAHPERALRLLHVHGLSKSVFHPPLDAQIFKENRPITTTFEEETWNIAYSSASKMHEVIEKRFPHVLNSSDKSENDLQEVRYRMLGAVLIPVAGLSFYAKKQTPINVSYYIIRESLKLKTKDASDISLCLNNYPTFQSLVNKNANRSECGMLLRTLGPLWTVCRDIALVEELVSRKSKASDYSEYQVYERYENFSGRLEEWDLLDVWNLKPLLNGKDLIRECKVQPGPKLGKLQKSLLIWQLENPQGSQQESIVYLKSTIDE